MKKSNKLLWFAVGGLFGAILAIIVVARINLAHHQVGYSGFHWVLSNSKVVGDGHIVAQNIPLSDADNNFHSVVLKVGSDIQADIAQRITSTEKARNTEKTESIEEKTAKPEISKEAEKSANTARTEASTNTANTVITCDSNLLPHIDTTVRNGVLYITTKQSIDLIPSRDIKIAINAKDLQSVVINGSGTFNVHSIKGSDFILDVHGSGDSILQGEVKNLLVTISGSGNVNAKNLNADNVKVIIKGSGDATVYAAQTIDAAISGSGNVQYYGAPKQITQTIRGSGAIIKR